MVTSPPVDLSDPVVLAAAVSKTNAIARTLLTSGGKTLDVTSAGAISATGEGIQASADTYRRVFETKDFESSPARLGLLSQPTGRTLADVRPWNADRIPTLDKAVVLTPQTVLKIEQGAPFKLDSRSTGLLRDRIDLRMLSTSVRLQNPG
jgi:hypothetical protein